MKNKSELFPRPGIPIQLAGKDGSKVETEIQIIRAGLYSHAWYGDFEITRMTLKSFVDNFDKKVMKNDLMIDYNHNVQEAAGWITALYTENKGTELWASIQWTPSGKQKLEGKEYRYISADFHFDHVDNESLESFGPTLYGAALTNRPFVKGMAPTVNLNEIGGNMDPKELKQLSERVSGLEVSLKEKDGEVKQLSEKVSSLEKANSDLVTENTKLKDAQAVAAKEGEFSKLLSEGKAVPAQKDAFMKGDMIEFAKLAGKVNLNESGSGRDAEPVTESAEDKLIRLADERAKKDGILVADAMSLVLRENPELAKAVGQAQ